MLTATISDFRKDINFLMDIPAFSLAIIGLYFFFRFILLLFLIYNIDFARNRIESRYSHNGWENENYIKNIQSFEEITPYLQSIGIKKDDRVICLSDNSINISLYMMNQKGWTNFGIDADSIKIEEKINLGAKYLFIYNKETIRRTCFKIIC